jgi:hypothetical protein
MHGMAKVNTPDFKTETAENIFGLSTRIGLSECALGNAPPRRLEAACKAKSKATSARSSRVKALRRYPPSCGAPVPKKEYRRTAQLLAQYDIQRTWTLFGASTVNNSVTGALSPSTTIA